MQPRLSTLYSCARLALINHLILHPFDQSVRCTEWEQITPTILPPSLPGSCACACTRAVLAPCHSSPLKKVSLGTAAALSHHLAFHTLHLSGKSKVCLGQGQSQPTSSPAPGAATIPNTH